MITLKSVDPVSMRYVTTGDWEWLANGDLKCSVAEYGNPDGEFLVNLHELVEAWLCKKVGIRAGDEVEEKSYEEIPSILVNGPRFWAELHLYGIRHRGKNSTGWLNDWKDSIPFNGCPCKEHLDDWIAENPPDWKNFFMWGVDLHNAVNLRIGKPTMDIENARLLWTEKCF